MVVSLYTLKCPTQALMLLPEIKFRASQSLFYFLWQGVRVWKVHIFMQYNHTTLKIRSAMYWIKCNPALNLALCVARLGQIFPMIMDLILPSRSGCWRKIIRICLLELHLSRGGPLRNMLNNCFFLTFTFFFLLALVLPISSSAYVHNSRDSFTWGYKQLWFRAFPGYYWDLSGGWDK